MKRSQLFKMILSAIFAFTAKIALADVPTPSPTATPTPEACSLAQDCIDSAVTTGVASCVQQNNCTPPTKFGSDPFALSAGTLADRAIALKNCSTKTTRFGCRLCYELAAAPLRFRYDGALLHGLFGQAVHQIRDEKRSVCSSLPR